MKYKVMFKHNPAWDRNDCWTTIAEGFESRAEANDYVAMERKNDEKWLGCADINLYTVQPMNEQDKNLIKFRR